MKKSKVLLLDKDYHAKATCEKALADNYEVHCTDSGPEAVTALETHAFEVVIVDVLQEGTGATDVLQYMRKYGMDIPVIITGRDVVGRDIVPKVATGSVVGFMNKPFSQAQLSDWVEKACRSTVAGLRRTRVLEALRKCNGSQTEAAILLQVPFDVMFKKIREYGISPSEMK